MTDDVHQALRAELGHPLPEGLDALDDAELRELAAQLREARERQSAAVDDAIDAALMHLPAIIRDPARAILLG